jgi:drug/metabolite transporter (DMT)-like permease
MASSAIMLALFSLFFNGCNDTVFKKYALKSRSRGMMIAGSGLVWTLWQCLYLVNFSDGISTDSSTVYYGLTAGLILVLANILLLESLTHLQISLCSTIYRLNTIGVVILSYVFLNEDLGWLKLVAIGLGIISVLLLYHPSEQRDDRNLYLVFLVIIVVASLLRASYGVLSKHAIDQGASILGMIPYSSICWVFGGLLYAGMIERRLRLTRKKCVYMLISGTLVFLTVTCLLQAISLGQASIIIPIANCSFIVALCFSILLQLEQMTKIKFMAILVALASIIMLSGI